MALSGRACRRAGALLAFLLSVSWFDPGLAQEPSDPLDPLVRALAEGRAALGAEKTEPAIAAFRHAQGLLGQLLLYGERERFFVEESAAIYRGLAEAYLRSRDPYAAAVEAYRGVNLVASDARLWTLLGLARHQMADIDGAAEALGRAVLLDPDAAEAHWGLGLVAIAENRPSAARDHGRRAYEISERPRFALGLAQWAAVDGDYAAAGDALATYLALAPEDPSAESYRRLRRFYRELGRAPVNVIDERVTRLQLSFDLKPGDEIPYVPVRINGRESAYILFDTGAERNVIDRSYAESIGVGPILPGGPLHGAYRQSPGGYAIVDSVAFGSVTAQRVPFAVGDFAALNLRGQGDYYIAAVINPALVFREFLVILDLGHRRIELVRYGAGGETYIGRQTRLRKNAIPFHFDVNGVWPVVPVSLDGARALPFLVDTGASDVFIARETAAALMLDPARFVASAGGYSREDLRFLMLDGALAEPWGIAVHGILGFPFFRGMRVAFDYRSMTMVLEN